MGLSLSDSFHSYQVYGLILTSNLPLEPWLPFWDGPASLIVEGRQIVEEFPIPTTPPLLISVRTDQSGEPFLSLFKLGKTLHLKVSMVGDFLIDWDKIRVQFHPGADLVIICAILLSTVLALWLELHKIRTIHACCLLYKGRAAAFMADSKTGKSTLAAALLQSNAALLSDDIIPIVETPGGFFASPGYPTMRLSEEQTRYFLGKQFKLAHWFPALGKVLIPVGKNGWGNYCNIPQKIQRLYVLNRIPSSPNNKVRFEPLSQSDSVLALIRFSFLTSSILALGMATERMTFFTRLGAQVRVIRLTYPSGYKHLAEVTQQIFQDMDECKSL